MSTPSRTIGVFDSGFGGLTVLRALLPLIPNAHYLYLGDTARLPYGAKSQTTIARYAVESARFLEDNGADRLVIACNTATALALPDIIDATGVPVTGVILPGAEAAKAVAENAIDVLVLATAATVSSHAYRDTAATLGLQAHEKACPLLVPLVEEGWTNHPVLFDVIRIYLREALDEMSALGRTPAAVLLGCTHYPLIAEPIQRILRELGSSAIVVDSADATAHAVTTAMQLTPSPQPSNASFTCYATDSVEKFARLGSLFLQQPIAEVRLLDLGG
ncbi:MAG: glutamate racemase [Acidobacteriaceae bacterium]|nr:glutamate racemase [Acidobacteriaceae bacterium]